MCGLVGLLRYDDRIVEKSVVDAMTDKLAHRGPDGRGVWLEGPVGLGHRRLAVRDLSDAGQQPFHSRCNRVVIVFNGEIYNDKELFRELERETGFIPRTRCDTEVLPAGWLAWGPELFNRLEGMFACALYDRQTRQLVLGRDPVGIKPLYYHLGKDALRFASETKAFYADPSFREGLSPADLNTMLAQGFVDPDRSIIKNVRQVPPGSFLLIDGREHQQKRYWAPCRSPEIFDLAEATAAVRSTLDEVMADQVVSDVPLAVLQSGGIDSTLVNLSLPENCDASLFTVKFANKEHDETALAQQVADFLGRRLSTLGLADGDLESDFRDMVYAFDGALADSSGLATFRLTRTARQTATVALSGDGADEFFAGYPTYRASALASATQRFAPAPAWHFLAAQAFANQTVTQARVGRAELLGRLFSGLGSKAPHVQWRRYLRADQRQPLFGPELAGVLKTDPLAAYSEAMAPGSGEIWDRCLHADQRYYLPGDMLMKVDRTSMAHGLEVRVPFLDRRMMTLAQKMDRRLLANYRGDTKIVLRETLRKAGVPQAVTNARKMGFNVPINSLLTGGLNKLAKGFLDREPDILSPYLKPDGVRDIWRAHASGKQDNKYVIWTLLTLATWLDGQNASS